MMLIKEVKLAAFLTATMLNPFLYVTAASVPQPSPSVETIHKSWVSVAVKRQEDGQYNQKCYGVLIDRQWVLTTPRCLGYEDGLKHSNEDIKITIDNQSYPISRQVYHPEAKPFVYSARVSDLALLKLAHSAPKSVKPIPVSPKLDGASPNWLTVIGKNNFNSDTVEYMSSLSVSNTSDTRCQNLNETHYNPRGDFLCVFLPGDTGLPVQNSAFYSVADSNGVRKARVDYGDWRLNRLTTFGYGDSMYSGTPLMISINDSYYLYGIYNYRFLNLNHNTKHLYGDIIEAYLFTNLQDHLDWIQDTMSEN